MAPGLCLPCISHVSPLYLDTAPELGRGLAQSGANVRWLPPHESDDVRWLPPHATDDDGPSVALDEFLLAVYLPYISPISPVYLPYISPISPLYLPYISRISPLYLDSGALKGKLVTPSAARDDDALAELPPRSTAAARC